MYNSCRPVTKRQNLYRNTMCMPCETLYAIHWLHIANICAYLCHLTALINFDQLNWATIDIVRPLKHITQWHIILWQILTLSDAPICDDRMDCNRGFHLDRKQHTVAIGSQAPLLMAFPFFPISDPSFLIFNFIKTEHFELRTQTYIGMEWNGK